MNFLPILPMLLLATPAQDSGESCERIEQPWLGAIVVTAAADPAAAQRARLTLDEPATVHLSHDPEVAYLTLPKGAGEPSSYGGLASFEVMRAGRYRVGLEEPAWVDVVADDKPAKAVSFGRAPACSGMHKQVTFDLQPGRYVLEISGNLDADLGVVVERLE